MPELPEVEFGRKVAAEALVGRTVSRVWCDADPIVLEGVSAQGLARGLKNRRVLAAHRLGKYIWLQLDQRPWPLFHFGMTGAFCVPSSKPINLESGPRSADHAWPPRFSKVRLWLDDGGQLVMTNARRFGRVRLLEDPTSEAPLAMLGFDPLLAMPALREFAAKVSGRRITIKGLLLDQSFAAGVGNWIADEVLYQAGINPRRVAAELSSSEVRRVRSRLGHVIRRAVAVDADKKRFPRSWLFHHRWGRNREARTSNGERIEHIKVAGRSTAWVPARQS